MEIKIVKHVLAENETLANDIRRLLRDRNQSMFNFMSSPGSGKTKLLEALIPVLIASGKKIGVIEGDITSTKDAERLAPLGVPVAQVNTEFFGGDCHLAANVVLGGIQALEKSPLDIILLENVGNLVCPAEFDTGSDLSIVLLSVTEGEDKPLKYPVMFRNCDIALVNKVDIAQVVDADVELMKQHMLQVNPALTILETSGKTGQGIDELAELLVSKHREKIS